jgi:hypothetical protein
MNKREKKFWIIYKVPQYEDPHDLSRLPLILRASSGFKKNEQDYDCILIYSLNSPIGFALYIKLLMNVEK